MKRLYLAVRIAAFVALIALCLTGQTRRYEYSKRDKAFFADPAVVAFVRPGLVINITSAQVAQDGTISVTFGLTDPKGAPLDRSGIATPGPVSLNFIAAYIPKGQEQYVDYITRSATGSVSGTVTQAAAESNGVFTSAGDGYRYDFSTHAPSGFDPTTTHTIGIYASRDLTEFDLGTNYASATFNFVPNGSAVTLTRDVIRTQSCNRCHDQLSAHGGSRRGVEMCVLCHTPQTTDPDTGNTVDLPVMVHKIHMGSELPSVQAGKPYQIIGFQGSVNDWSTVVLPSDPRRCEVCHAQDSGATQANAYLTKPARVACGACHDDVNFATGANHPGGFQTDDAQCANCHVPQGETPFDASIMGAHVVPTDTKATYPQNPDTLLAGINLAIVSVTNTTAGSAPTVNFTMKDDSGNNIPLSKLGSLSLIMSGPTTDYGATNFGSDTTNTPGYVSESALKAPCDASGNCAYTFTHVVPAGSTGTFAIGGESRMSVTVLPGTNAAQTFNVATKNPVAYFSVDGSTVSSRRTVVAISNCNGCHVALSLHGGNRNQTEMCVLCHNPSNSDFTQRPNAVDPSDKTQPPQGINFNLLVHRIHSGPNVVADGGKPYIVVGFNGSHNDFSDVGYPAMGPTGSVGVLDNCSMCHANGSEQNLPLGLNQVTDPQGWINPVEAIASACSGCHVSKPAASHFLANTDVLGESCTICHASGAQFAVDAVHAQ